MEAVHVVFQHSMTEFQKHLAKVKPTDQVKWQRLYVMGLLHAAAMLAVDAGMTDSQFATCAITTHQKAHERAPKFS